MSEYKWEDSGEERSHPYLLNTINSIFNKKKFNFNNTDLLDLGCGNGYLTKKISDLNNFKSIKAIDTSAQGISYAKNNYNGIIKFYHKSIDDLILSGEKYNFVTCFEVIEHVYNPDLFLKNIVKIIHDDGHILISTPFHGYIKNLLISLLNNFDHHFDPLWMHGHIKFFSKKTFKIIANRNNLHIVDIYYSGRVYPISKSMFILLKKI
tara:strand:- start:3968 stop:4591 length:624 start_codon:yes stop_codon:yes gene_type:complete